MTDARTRRIAKVRFNAAVRLSEYRQRNHAKGFWFRLRRELAHAKSAYSVSDADADAAVAEGFVEQPVGHECEPKKRMFVVPAERVEALATSRPLTLRLDQALLEARCLVLIRF